MTQSSPEPITGLLTRWRHGDEGALEELVPLVYDELRRLASRAMRSESSGHTLQPTALVHEALARLMGADVPWKDRVHFFAVATRTMRRVLVDHARAQRREKRGGGNLRVTLDENLGSTGRSEDLLALDETLNALARQDARKAHAVELHYFGGLSYEETAEVLQISPATVHRELRLAKAWLYDELTSGGNERA